MIPILTSDEMRAADAVAVAARGTDALVAAAGTAVGLEAKRLLGTCYGQRVAVIAGPGLNGSDGRVAAAWLRSRGAHVEVFDVAHQPAQLDGYALVIDAAFGLGCTRAYVAPRVASETLVLAVDLPSGVEADTGEILGTPLHADVTLAIGALKYAHITGAAASIVGRLRFAGLGIVQRFADGLIDDGDLLSLLEGRDDDHKWKHAVQALVGSTRMPGAAELVVRGALAGGASMIRLSSRGDVAAFVDLPPEVVHADENDVDPRCQSVVAGPGLGSGAASWLRERLRDVAVPVVLDADGLDRALVSDVKRHDVAWILTPHEGEFVRLTGTPMPADRVAAVRSLAKELDCVVLLKGPTTLIAGPDGTLRVVRSGTAALATAGTGDVLAGLIAASVARGHDALTAGALAAHLHGRAGARLAPYAPASALIGEVAEIIRTLGHYR